MVHSQKILALYCGREHFNVWVYLSPTINAWCKLAPNDDDGLIDMTTFAAHAKGFDRFVDAEMEGNLVRRLYVW